MADATMSFSEAASAAVIASDYPMSDAQASQIDRILSDGPRTRIARRRVYERLVAENATLPDGTPIANLSIDAVPWANIIQLLMQLLPTLIPLICPPKP